MSVTAIAMRPELLMRARELCGDRADLDAEDLVGCALLRMCEKPPDPQSDEQLLHWLRTVIFRLNANAYRDLRGAEFVTWEEL
ncbi:MAG: hypothetical protein ACHQ0J_05155 [Candidatus Dormibacterales bacterium]